MNPYDFARINWERKPERKKPVWHNRLVGNTNQKLYSGQLEIDIDALTPLFIVDPRYDPANTREPALSLQNDYGEYIIPGSSLKGMLRTVVETLGNGCLTLFDGEYDHHHIRYRDKIDRDFRHCWNNTNLCISCRTFGMLEDREGRGNVFLGKINIGDAFAYKHTLYQQPFYTGVLVEPKPRHKAFYLDQSERYIAGRKFYFHHSPNGKPISSNGLQKMGGKPANRYIQPLAKGTQFQARIDFTNLEEDEFGALLLAVVLEKEMRHKIGYGKPLGMGSVELIPIKLTLVDYSTRYTQWKEGQGKQVFERGIWTEIDRHLNIFYNQHLQTLAMEDLRRIWRFPPEPGVNYYYPSKKEWFDKPISQGKRIADTRSVPRQM